MSVHTPGPWTMQTVRTDCGVCFKVGPFPWKRGQINHACIYADYPGNGPEYQQLVANAMLITAAPELLAACLAVVAESEKYRSGCPHDPGESECIAIVRDAIAKATGATS